MRPDRLVSAAAAPLGEVAGGITNDLLAVPTPCAGYDVRALIAHLLHWAPSLAGAGRKTPVPPPGADPAPPGHGWRTPRAIFLIGCGLGLSVVMEGICS